MPVTDIAEIYNKFLNAISSKREFIAPLQLTGKLEDYLVHELISYTYKMTGGEILGLTNFGKSGKKNHEDEREQKFDISFVKKINHEQEEIVAVMEAKYLRNIHRYNEKWNAKDEITITLNNFSDQLKGSINKTHGDLPVNLSASDSKVYGLMFASFVKEIHGNDSGTESDKDEFYDPILDKAKKRKFVCYNGGDLKFDDVYDNEEVQTIGRKFSVTLKAGLWRSDEKI